MNIQQFKRYRLLFVRQGCLHCRKYFEFIERINSKLPVNKRIRIIDCTYYQQYGIISDPLIALFNKYIDGFPTLILDGHVVSGINSNIETLAFLNTYLSNEYTIPEDSRFIFDKDCEFKKSGLIRGTICK